MYLNGCFFDRCPVQIIPNWKFVGVILNVPEARVPKENIGTSKDQTLQKLKLMMLAHLWGKEGLQLCPTSHWQKRKKKMSLTICPPHTTTVFNNDLT